MLLRDAVHPPTVLHLLPTPTFAAMVLGGLLLVAVVDAREVRACFRSRPPDVPMLALASFQRAPVIATHGELELAKREVAAYAFEAFPRWALNNVDRACPDRLLELNREMPSLHAVDPWGTPYQFLCGAQHRVTGLRVRSAGPDHRFETPDDLASH